MSSALTLTLLVLALVALLLGGHSQIADGSDRARANGAVLLVLALLVGQVLIRAIA